MGLINSDLRDEIFLNLIICGVTTVWVGRGYLITSGIINKK